MVDRYCKVRDQCVEPPGLCTRRVRNGKEERRQEMKIVYDSRSKEYMVNISFIILRIQASTKVTIVDCKEDNLSLPNFGQNP